jgi:hypothetical protein
MLVTTLCGLKAHVAPAGRPEHVNVTGCLKPFCGVIANVMVPADPAATLRPELLIENEKLAAGAAATVTIVAVEFEAL